MKHNIENYDSMTTEEKLAALEAYEPDMSGYIPKATFDKTASELAAAKKSLREHMSEEEAKATRDAEERAELMARVKELEDERAVNGYVTNFLALGYEEALARSTAQALAKGDMATVFANQKTHTENREKALRTELLKQTPPPPSGGEPAVKTREEFAKMSLVDKQKFAAQNPELYASFYKE